MNAHEWIIIVFPKWPLLLLVGLGCVNFFVSITLAYLRWRQNRLTKKLVSKVEGLSA